MRDAVFIKRDTCPACGSSCVTDIYTATYLESPIINYLHVFYGSNIDFSWLADTLFTVVECKTCSLLFQKNVMDNKTSSTFYSTVVASRVNSGKELSINNDNVKISYTKFLGDIILYLLHRDRAKNQDTNISPQNWNFLDYGCGYCTWAKIVKENGIASYGYDISDHARVAAQKEEISFISADDAIDNYYDFININQVLEHVNEPCRLISHAVSLLKDDGILYISVPNGSRTKELLTTSSWYIPKYHPDSLNSIAPLEHINCFSNSSIFQMTIKNNLEPIETIRFCYKKRTDIQDSAL